MTVIQLGPERSSRLFWHKCQNYRMPTDQRQAFASYLPRSVAWRTLQALDAIPMFRSLLIIAALALAGCAGAPPLGPISVTALRQQAPAFNRSETANPDELQGLRTALASHGPVELTVFFGDWCSDSVREVPRLLALTEHVPSNQLQMNLINLDRSKVDAAGLAAAAGISRIPTIIVRRNGQELGRIVELPQQTVGADLVRLLNPPG